MGVLLVHGAAAARGRDLSSPARALLVTGDDFGLRESVNAAIAGAHREGILTSASLMVTGDAVPEAVALARELPGLSTGLHLVLSGREAPAASDPARIPDLVDASGRFPASPAWAGVSDVLFWPRRRPQIEREIRAQIERFLATGLSLDHVDGHHHLHLHPLIFDLLLAALEEFGVRFVRLVEEDAVARRAGVGALDEAIPRVFGALSRRARGRMRRHGKVSACDRVYGLRASGRMTESEALRLLPLAAGRVVELYAHPDRGTESGRAEEAALCSAAVREAVARAGFRLVNSRTLSQGAAA